MNELQVIKIDFFNEFYKYKKYNVVTIIIPNLEMYRIKKESIMNFHNRLCNELYFNLELKSIEKNSSNYIYYFRYTANNYTINTNIIEEKINNIFKTFPFIFIRNNKRKLNSDDKAVKKYKIDY